MDSFLCTLHVILRIDMEKFNDSDDTEGSNNSEATAENLDELAMAKNIAQDFVEKGSDNIESISLESDQVVKVSYSFPSLLSSPENCLQCFCYRGFISPS